VCQCTAREVENIRVVDVNGDAITVGTTTKTAQNGSYLNIDGRNAAGSVWVLDGGAGNNDFDGCYGERGGRYVIEIKRSGASATGGYTVPTCNRWHGGIFERPATVAPLSVADGLGVLLQTAGSDNEFYGSGLNNSGITTVDMPIVEVKMTDAGATASRLAINGTASFLDGNTGTATGIKVNNSGEVVINGRPFIRNVLYAVDFDDTATIQLDRIRWGSSITNRYRQRGSQKAPRRITDLLWWSKSDWPTNALAVTTDRSGRLDQITLLTSGTLYLTHSREVLPAGVPIDSLTFVSGGTGATTPTNQWACLVDESLNVLAKSNDDTTTAWAGDAAKTFTFATPYVPTADAALYFGLMVAAATPPQIMCAASRQGPVAIAPRLFGPSTTGLTTPASLGATATAVGVGGNVPFAYAL
jgi:hypothetical protein